MIFKVVQGWGMQHQHILKLSRLEGLTDGVFAIAMTILVLELRLPENLSPTNLSQYLVHLVSFKLFIFAGSFIILGTLWIAVNFQLGFIHTINRPFMWVNVFYLMGVCVVPFSASLLGTYPENVASIDFYAINLLYTTLGQITMLYCALLYKLQESCFTKAIYRAVVQRILFAPGFYVAALLLASYNTRLAFSCLLVPTLFYMKPGKVDMYNRDLQ